MIDGIGKINDNSEFSMPICAFNTHTLQVYNYSERIRDFKELKYLDDDQLA
jgi:hypothetical protein